MENLNTPLQAPEGGQERVRRFEEIIRARVQRARLGFSLLIAGASTGGNPNLKPMKCESPDAWRY